MKILSGVYAYGTHEGSILYNGQELKLMDRAIRQARQSRIAIVYQELTLVPTMTVGENIFLGKEPVENGAINWNKLYSDAQRHSIVRWSWQLDQANNEPQHELQGTE